MLPQMVVDFGAARSRAHEQDLRNGGVVGHG
jgi:hypothetical protein